MSTRSVIARPAGDGWEGRYHHWDGYPTALGCTLWGLYHGHFAADLDRMTAFLIEEHPGGWSTINSADWSHAPGYDGPGPQCYCHGARDEEETALHRCMCPHDNSGCDPLFIEWAYVLSPGGLAIYDAYNTAGSYPNHHYVHRLRGIFPWSGEEPDWSAIEQAEPAEV